MVEPKRISLKRGRLPAGAIYVGPGSPYANPYATALSVHSRWFGKVRTPQTAAEAVDLCKKELVQTLLENERSIDILLRLRGLDLACWCHLCDVHKAGKPFFEVCPDCAPCHADVLLELANA
jgi:hypothetical protein